MLRNCILIFFLLWINPACISLFLPTHPKWEELGQREEDLRFEINNVKAKILWKAKCQSAKKNIKGWIIYRGEYYYLDGGPWIARQKEVYVLDKNHILVFDAKTGTKIKQFDIPELLDEYSYEGFFWRVFEYDNKIAIRIDMGTQFLLINGSETKNIEIKPLYRGRAFPEWIYGIYYGGKIFLIETETYGQYKLRIIDPYSGTEDFNKKYWTHYLGTNFFTFKNGFLCTLSSRTYFFPKTRLECFNVLSPSNVFERSVETLYGGKHISFIDVVSDKVILSGRRHHQPWKPTFVAVVDIKSGKEWNHKGLLLTNLPYFDDMTTIHLWRKETPNQITEVNVEDGQEQKPITLPFINPNVGIFDLQGKLIYFSNTTGGDQEQMELNAHGFWEPFNMVIHPRHASIYDSVIGYDKNADKELWRLNLGRMYFKPFLDHGILYFGDVYEGEFFEPLLLKEKVLSNTAIALDPMTGEFLWKIRLVGRDSPFVARVVVQDHMAFIKSTNGWLYAIHWE